MTTAMDKEAIEQRAAELLRQACRECGVPQPSGYQLLGPFDDTCGPWQAAMHAILALQPSERETWGPIDHVDNGLTLLSEALFQLSNRMRLTGFLNVDENHTAYEAVVRDFAKLRTAIRALNTGATLSPAEPSPESREAAIEECARIVETLPIGGGTLSSWVNTNESPLRATRRHFASAIRALSAPAHD